MNASSNKIVISKSSSQVVIVIIVHKPEMSWFERISLDQCFDVLGSHSVHLVCPKGLDVSEYVKRQPTLMVDFIDPHWQSTYEDFAHLKVMPMLYKMYSSHEYILFYELDAFVFRDDLLEWCGRGYDYIGAPWFEGFAHAVQDSPPLGVGNGGFSLRRIEAMLKVTRTWRYIEPPQELFRRWRGGLVCGRQVLRKLLYTNNYHAWCNDYYGPEDLFWGKMVTKDFNWFKVAPYEEARDFAFEVNPERLSGEIGGNLPFGCHKWMVYDPLFWREPIESFGYEFPSDFINTQSKAPTIDK